jgi:hypothetical protein
MRITVLQELIKASANYGAVLPFKLKHYTSDAEYFELLFITNKEVAG